MAFKIPQLLLPLAICDAVLFFETQGSPGATGGLSAGAEFVGRIPFLQVCQYEHEARECERHPVYKHEAQASD